jgi:acyl-[acyl-carrier-protein] desaturase
LGPLDDVSLLSELRPVVDGLVERHLSRTQEWFPHELVPWSRGRDFEPGYEWDPEEFPLPDAIRSALIVNLLTEDNLPYYFSTIDGVFGHEGWREWTRRWTAEEMRHAMVIRDYLTVTRALDPVRLERDRMVQVSTAETPQPDTVRDMIVYLCLQELATRISHRNTGKMVPDPAGEQVMARVAADENWHFLFYRDLALGALEVDPSGMMEAIERQVTNFEMPGTGIPGFVSHAIAIARSGIYNLSLHHDQIVCPVVLRQWKVDDLTGLSPEAEQARDNLHTTIERLQAVARRQAERLARRAAKAAADGADESESVLARS